MKNIFAKTLKEGLPFKLTTKEALLASRLKKEIGVLNNRFGREPTNAEIAFVTGLPAGFVDMLIKATTQPLSMDTPFYEDGEETIEEKIKGENGVQISSAEYRADIRNLMNQAYVSDLQQAVILLKLKEETYIEIGKTLNISSRYAQVLYRNGIKQLENYCKTKNITWDTFNQPRGKSNETNIPTV
jgi:DNA-directed RNA polymerase specialized sigma subunit